MPNRYLFRPRSQDILFFFLIVYWVISLVNPSLLSSVLYQNQGDVLYSNVVRSSFFYIFPLCFLVGPLFLLYISKSLAWFSYPFVAIRFKSSNRLIVRQSFAAVRLSAVFLAFLYLLTIISCCVYDQISTINPLELILCYILQLLACFSLTQIYYILILLTKSAIFACLGTYALFALQYFLQFTAASFTIPILNWMSTIEISTGYLTDLIAAVFLNLCLLFIQSFIVDKREWYRLRK